MYDFFPFSIWYSPFPNQSFYFTRRKQDSWWWRRKTERKWFRIFYTDGWLALLVAWLTDGRLNGSLDQIAIHIYISFSELLSHFPGIFHNFYKQDSHAPKAMNFQMIFTSAVHGKNQRKNSLSVALSQQGEKQLNKHKFNLRRKNLLH